MIIAFAIAVICIGADPVRLPGQNARTLERLHEGSELERTGNALTHYEKLLEDAADDWAPTDDPKLLRPCRTIVLERIAANPKLRAAYLARHEDATAAAVRTAIERKNATALDALARDRWPTRAAGRALDALGDLACERGDPAAARAYWRQLVGPARPGERQHPEPGVDVATVRAKILVASRLLEEPMAAEFERFQHEFPEAAGRLAGRDGKFYDILISLTKDTSARLPRRDPALATTFAGNPARAGALSAALPQLAPRHLEPEITLVEPDADAANAERAGHPLIWHGLIVIGRDKQILAIDPKTGETVDAYNLVQPIADAVTFSADGHRVYVRTGPDSIVSLERAAGSGVFRWKIAWELKATALGEGASLEGSPLVDGGRVFLSWLKSGANRHTVNVGCWVDGNQLWSRAIAELPADADVAKLRSNLLTLAGPNIVYSSDAGSVVAVEANTGRPAWAYDYSAQSRGARGQTFELLPPPRDLVPPVYAHGRVFVAPSDLDEVLALDAFTGAALWKTPPVVEVVHLLGVIGDRLIFTADGQKHGIGAVNISTGTIDSHWGDLSATAPCGRGLILDKIVLYPTKANGLLVLDHQGRPMDSPYLFRNVPGGNLAYAKGLLIIATAEKIVRLRFDQLAKIIVDAPPMMTAHLNLAPALTNLQPTWEVILPDDETPLNVEGSRLFSARNQSVIVRDLPASAKRREAAVGFKPIYAHSSKNRIVVYSNDRMVELDGPKRTIDAFVPKNRRLPGATVPSILHFVPAFQQQSLESKFGDFELRGATLRAHSWSLTLPDGPHWFVAPAGSDRIFAGQGQATWAWAERQPATHRWSGLLLEKTTGRVIDRITVPTNGPRVVVGANERTLVIAVPGIARGFVAP